MAPKTRLDAELVRRGLARSRQQAQDLVREGQVTVGGVPATKAATAITRGAPVEVRSAAPDAGYVSRGAAKLLGALDAFADLHVDDRRCLDAGASTGGFTEVLLRRGAREVCAVDVGYGQLAWTLRTDPRVHVFERTNVRALQPAALGGTVDVTVADLSFISLRTVLPALLSCTAPHGDLLALVKPQFEAGRAAVPAGGVVRDPAVRAAAVDSVAAAAFAAGWGTAGVVASPLPGPAGNVEYFLWLRRDAGPPRADMITSALTRGPA